MYLAEESILNFDKCAPRLKGTKPRWGRGGGVVPSYKPYRFVSPERVWFLRRLGLKTSIDFAHFGLESDMVFEGTTGVYERISRFNSE